MIVVLTIGKGTRGAAIRTTVCAAALGRMVAALRIRTAAVAESASLTTGAISSARGAGETGGTRGTGGTTGIRFSRSKSRKGRARWAAPLLCHPRVA